MNEYKCFKELLSIPCLYRNNFQYILPLIDDTIPRQTFLPRSIKLAKDNHCKLIILFDAEDDWNELMKTEDNSNMNLGDVTLDINLKSEQIDNSGHTILTWLSIPSTSLNNIHELDNNNNNNRKEEEGDVIPGLPQNDEYLMALLRFDAWKSHDNDGIPSIEAIRGFLSSYSIVESQLRMAASGDYDVNIMLIDIGARYHKDTRLWGIGNRTGTFIMIDALLNSLKININTKIEEKEDEDDKKKEQDKKEQEQKQKQKQQEEPVIIQEPEQKRNEMDRLEVISITERAVEATSEYVFHLAESRARSNERLARRLAQRRQTQTQHHNQVDKKDVDIDDDDECSLDDLEPDFKSVESESKSISQPMVSDVDADQLNQNDLPLLPPLPPISSSSSSSSSLSSSSFESKADTIIQPPPVPSFNNANNNSNNNNKSEKKDENEKEEREYAEDFGSDNMDIAMQYHLTHMLKHCESTRPTEKQLRFIKIIVSENYYENVK